MRKIAISLPDEQAEAVERVRLKLRIPRSRVIQRALEMYLTEEGFLEAIRRYEQGYQRRPERPEAVAFAETAAAVLGREEWK